MTDNKTTKFSKKHIIVAVIIATVTLVSIIIGVIIHNNSQKNEAEFDSKQIYNDYIEINEEAVDIEEKYATDGFIQPEDISTVLDELEVLAKEYESKGLISSYDKQATSIYFKLNSGIGYLYTPTVEELLAGDDVGKILTIEPYATSSEFVSNYLIGGKSPDKAAEKIVADLPDSYSFSKYDNWDSFSFEQVEQMGNHKIIIWYGHGGYVKEYGSVLGTSIPIKDQSSLLLYQLELSNGEMILGKDCFCVSPSYFEKHIEDNSLEGSLVFLGACQSAMDNRLAEVFINKGASLVVGNSQTIRIRYMLYMMDDFMSALTNQYDDGTYWTAEDALTYAKSQNGDSDSEFWAYGAEVKLIYPENKSEYRLYGYYDGTFNPIPDETTKNEETTYPTDEPDEPIVTPPLSQDCDKIIYTLRDGADYYEFVVNEEIGYPKNTYQFGVIKNNKWLVKMSSQAPFLNEDNSWKSLEDVGSNPLDEIYFEYLGEGCFLYYVDYFSTNINGSGIVYNPSTNVSLPVLNMSYYDNFENIVNDGQIVVLNRSFEWVLLNTNTGETMPISGYFEKDGEWSVERIQGISEGLFMARIEDFGWTTKYITGFFNSNGELIIDISEYGYPDKETDYRFNNGQCSFTTYNDTGVPFMITIDKSGKLIAQEKIEN